MSHDVSLETLLQDGLWTFLAGDRVLSAALRFRADGSLEGYRHPNENKWMVVDDALCFVSDKGRVTGELELVQLDGEAHGFRGRSRVDPNITFNLEPTTWEDRVRPPQLTRIIMSEIIDRFGWDIGDHTYGRPTVFERNAHLRIGKFCSIATGVMLALGNHRIDSISSYPFAALKTWCLLQRGSKITNHAGP